MKIFLVLLIALAVTSAVLAQVKVPEPTPDRPSIWDSRQIIVVTSPDWPSVSGTARLFERRNWKTAWKQVGEPFPVVVGRNGMEWSADFKLPNAPPARKREGDGKAPAGIFALTKAFGTAEKPAAMSLPYTKLNEFTECVDDTGSAHYNKIVNRMQVGNFDWKSSEKMLEVGPQYGLGVFVAYNTYPVISGNGSCIFLHVWKDPKTGTAGCTAMERSNLERITNWLSPAAVPFLIQMPVKEYAKHTNAWKLPKLD
jgi:D-alanyl-D-alanine dipeptidase